MELVRGPVGVEVPATSANLGPGFDCLGVALALHDTLTAEVVSDGLALSVTGEGAAELPTDETHLVVRAMRVAFEELAVTVPGLRLHCSNRIPQSRGLGSSSAAIVGGLVLARALVRGGADRLAGDALLELANRLEGHPDNVAPALLGGLVVSGQSDGDVWAEPAPIDPTLRAVVFMPPEGLSTELARGLLPEQVPHRDAVANTGRAALLLPALAGARRHLMRATEDFLHQDFREPAMPDSLALVRRLRAAGVPATISGAGPTVLAWSDASGAAAELAGHTPQGWRSDTLAVDRVGARVVAP